MKIAELVERIATEEGLAAVDVADVLLSRVTSRVARSRSCSNAGDFSRSSIEARIRAGYEDEKAHGVVAPRCAGHTEMSPWPGPGRRIQ